MSSSREIIKIPVEELTLIEANFKRYTGFDTSDIPEKYGDAVLNAKVSLLSSVEVVAAYQFADIAQKKTDSVTLDAGVTFIGDLPPRVLEHSSTVLCFVSTLTGYDEFISKEMDMMENVFADSWGTALIECVADYLQAKFNSALAAEHLKLTHMWSPGQYHFELENQRPLFALLKPEEFGLTLSDYCKMDPVKSVSGIFGVIPEAQKNTLLPCDFCHLSKTCPASRSGKCHTA